MAVCPKTLEYKSLTNTHASTIVHAVALWLEKIFTEDPNLKIADLQQEEIKNCADFDEQKDG